MKKISLLIEILLILSGALLAMTAFYIEATFFFQTLATKAAEIINSNFITSAVPAFFGAAGGAYVIYFIQAREKHKTDAKKHNEAIIYTSIFLEETATMLAGMVLKYLEQEDELSYILSTKKGRSEFSFNSIEPIEIISERNLINKIHNIGELTSVGQAFYRARNACKKFQAAADDRNELTKKLIGSTGGLLSFPRDEDRFNEIRQRTYMLAVFGETILDSTAFIIMELNANADDLKKDLKQKHIKGIPISKLIENKLHEETRIRLRDLIDVDPNFNPRFLHMLR